MLLKKEILLVFILILFLCCQRNEEVSFKQLTSVVIKEEDVSKTNTLFEKMLKKVTVEEDRAAYNLIYLSILYNNTSKRYFIGSVPYINKESKSFDYSYYLISKACLNLHMFTQAEEVIDAFFSKSDKDLMHYEDYMHQIKRLYDYTDVLGNKKNIERSMKLFKMLLCMNNNDYENAHILFLELSSKFDSNVLNSLGNFCKLQLKIQQNLTEDDFNLMPNTEYLDDFLVDIYLHEFDELINRIEAERKNILQNN